MVNFRRRSFSCILLNIQTTKNGVHLSQLMWLEFYSGKLKCWKEVIIITSNQLSYMSNREQQRHNVATEAETGRANLARESNASDVLRETIRHNQQGENLGLLNYYETSRSNQAREGETSRHNIATEGETYRSNRVREHGNYNSLLEQYRHNTELESVAARDAETRRLDLARRLSYDTAQMGVMESQIASNLSSANYAEAKAETEKITQPGKLLTSFLPFLR